MSLSLFALLALAPLSSLAAPHPSWAQPADSPFRKLFSRQTPIPPVGSDAWTALYPQAGGTPTSVPQSWTDAFNNAMAAGLIPNISVAVQNNGYPTYSDGSGTDPDICSFTYGCNATTDLNNPPDGIIALAFDDGPLPTSDPLYDFLASNHQHATHFMIGINILWNSPQFLHAYTTNTDHIAVHTWSHPYMTTLTNAEVVAELGWTVQIISDSTGGLLPLFWRPPYGDVDNRVRAIAENVYGLKTVTWNQDSADWSITTGSTTIEAVEGSLTFWVTGGKTPGLQILEHELTNDTVDAFEFIYPTMVSQGWQIKPVPDAYGFQWYQNALNSTSPLEYTGGVASPTQSIRSSTSAPATSSAASASKASTSGSASGSSASAKPSGSAGSSSSGGYPSVQLPAVMVSLGLVSAIAFSLL